MKQINFKAKFYAVAMRSAATIILLILFLFLVPQADMLKNQNVIINGTVKTGVEVAKVLISLIVVGILLNFAYIAEAQLPKITKYKRVGLVVASVVHIVVIFVAYYYLLPFARDRRGNVNQIFNIIFLILLCIPLWRGGIALNKTIGDITEEAVQPLQPSADRIIKCENCGKESDDSSAKFCKYCGGQLLPSKISVQIIVCSRCNYENESSAKFCANCGGNLLGMSTKSQTIKCPQCDSEIKSGTKYCHKCGTEIPGTAQMAEKHTE